MANLCKIKMYILKKTKGNVFVNISKSSCIQRIDTNEITDVLFLEAQLVFSQTEE